MAEHGTLTAYTNGKCRCRECSDHARRFRKKWEMDRANGVPRRVPPGPTLEHIAALKESGMSVSEIAAAAGFRSPHSIRILATRPSVSVRTQHRIQSIAPIPRERIPEYRIRRRLEALMFMGWSMNELGRRSHLDAETLRRHLRGSCQYATRGVADIVVRLYDELQNVDGGCAYAKTLARHRKYKPPAAWDNIDAKGARPVGVKRRRRTDG